MWRALDSRTLQFQHHSTNLCIFNRSSNLIQMCLALTMRVHVRVRAFVQCSASASIAVPLTIGHDCERPTPIGTLGTYPPAGAACAGVTSRIERFHIAAVETER